MESIRGKNEDIAEYITDQERIANAYLMKCFRVTIVVYSVAFLLNLLGIFIIDQQLMMRGYFSSLIIYVIVYCVYKRVSADNRMMKYFILFSVISFFTIAGVFITYHVVLATLLPFLYGTLYSSKRVMKYVYILTVVSTIIDVYGGYYYGLCDANMVLLTTERMQNYVQDGQFLLIQVNENPYLTLLLFFVVPRCFIYVAFMYVCNSIYTIVSGSLEKARLTEELEEAKEKAEKASLAKTQFLNRMSHEIRTPINAIIGMNEMILRGSSEPEICEYAGDVKASSGMLLSIVNEILDSSKIESGRMESVAGDYGMGSLLHDVYNMIRMKAEEKNLKLVFDIAPSVAKSYHGDDRHIRQVLLNLLTNAVKYTEKGTVTLIVTDVTEDHEEEGNPAQSNATTDRVAKESVAADHVVEGSAAADRMDGDKQALLRFTIADTGIGIKQEDIEKIYDDFQRFDLSRNRAIEGTGLGMNIVRQLLKLMGSDLEISSEYGKGSAFSFELKQKVVDPAPLGDFMRQKDQESETAQKRVVYRAPGARVLVVDDNAMNLKVFKALLKHTEIKITEAGSGRECLGILQNHAFDMVFLDHMMPEMDGIETFHAIREQGLCKGTPIIMLTANAGGKERERYIKEGVDDFLSKPVMPDKLDQMILRYLPDRYVVREEKEEHLKENSGERPEESRREMAEESMEEIGKIPKEAEAVSGKDIYDALQACLPEIDFEKGLMTCGGDREFYLELLQDFTQLTVKSELAQYLSASNDKNYCIRVHGFKNSAYSIGASALGDLAYEMEKGTKEGLSENISTLQAELFEMYDHICQRYRDVTKTYK